MIAELFEKAGIKGRLTDGGSPRTGSPGAVPPAADSTILAPFTRCLECNVPLREISIGEAAPRVPPRIARDFKEFHECPTCGRVYWKGSHYEAMVTRVGRILERLGISP